jgi:hypothetical protein
MARMPLMRIRNRRNPIEESIMKGDIEENHAVEKTVIPLLSLETGGQRQPGQAVVANDQGQGPLT